jgi:aminoglycoside phosphotransferase
MEPELPEFLESRLEEFSFVEIKLGMSGARVFKLEGSGETLFLKFAPVSSDPDPAFSIQAESDRLKWLRSKNLAVPKVELFLEAGRLEYLLMTEIPGHDASQLWPADQIPSIIAKLATGLRAWHDTNTNDCPYQLTLETRIAQARARTKNAGLKLELEALLEHAPKTEDLVLCHGDPCVPNVLLTDGLEISGWIDLGRAGVMDRHWDLALIVGSLEMDLNPQFNGWSECFLETYGLDVVNRETLEFYIQFDRFFWGD